jgi:hypothetical protein
MSHPGQSNSGFRPQEIRRQKFQEAAALTIDKQALAIQQTREYLADLAVRVERLQRDLIDLEAMVRTPVSSWRERLLWCLKGR